MRIIVVLFAGAMALAGCSPKAEAPTDAAPKEGAADAPIVPENPFFGKWQLVRAQVAPWWDGKGAEPAADPGFTMLDFEPGKSSGPPIVTCAKPLYSVSLVTPADMFQGNLKEPWVQARALGYPINGTGITSLNLGCKDGGKDTSLDFPMQAEDTIMVGLDNVIYTLQRTPK